MLRKPASIILLFLLAVSVLVLAFNVQLARAVGGTIIRADGSIDPPGILTTTDNVTYTLTGDILGSIKVERDNIVVNGAGYTIQGSADISGITLDGISNVTIENMNITNNLIGICLTSCSNISISGNNIIGNGVDGIYLGFSNNNSVSGNNITANGYPGIGGIELSCSNNNSLSGNNITDNHYGIAVIIFCSGNSVYHNNFINNFIQVFYTYLVYANSWDDGYPSGGNYWSDYNGTDLYSGPYQNQTGNDGIGDMPYIIYSNNKDNYPLMSPWSPHAVAVSYVKALKTVVGQGYSANITVTVANQGSFSETFFNVTAYANNTAANNVTSIGTFINVTLAARTYTNLTLVWDTTEFVRGNYTLSAYAWPFPSETNFTDGCIVVSIAGDLTGGTPNPWDFVPDGKVDGKDIAIVALCFGSAPGCSPPWIWNANCDVSNDGKIDGKDIALVAMHYGQ